MQYNSFEERINRKLANATLPPRGEVWDRIHHDLQEPPHNNKKKWGILGLCLLLCATSTGIYMCCHQKEKTVISNTSKIPAQKQETVATKTSIPLPPQSKQIEKPVVDNKPKNESSLAQTPAIVKNEATEMKKKRAFLLQNGRNTIPEKAVESGKKAFVSPPKTDIPPNTIAQNFVIPFEKEDIAKKSEIPSNTMAQNTSIPFEKEIIAEKPEIPSSKTINKTIQPIEKQAFISTYLTLTKAQVSPNILADIPTPKGNHTWTWNISAGNYAILYEILGNNHQTTAKNARQLASLGVANIGVGDSTSSLQVYNDQSLSIASQIIPVNDTSLLKITISPNTQFATFGGEYRHSRRFGIEGALAFYYQKMNRILIPTSDIANFDEAIASSKTTPYRGNETSAIPFNFYVLSPQIMANAHFGKNRSDLALGTGIAYRALIGSTDNNAALRIAQIGAKDAKVYTSHNAAILARAKYTYHISEKMGIFGALNTQVMLRRMYSQGISYKSPILLGVEMGLSF